MNENNNRISGTIPATVYQNVMTHLDDLQQLLAPYMTGLTAEERKTLPKINVDNKAFVEDAIQEMANPAATAFMPAYISPTEAQGDLAMFNQLETVASRLATLTGVVDGTRLLAGSEAYTTGLAFKRLADAAAASGIQGAEEVSAKLKERFASHGRSGEVTPETTEAA